jgi:hypothetical protein
MKNKKLTLALILAAIICAGIFFSPYLAIHQLRNAVIDRDVTALSEHVDFPVLKENIKLQLMEKMSEKLNALEMKNNPFAAIGQALAYGIVDKIVDTMISPSGLITILSYAKVEPVHTDQAAVPGSDTEKSSTQPAAKFSLQYQDWSTVTASPKANDGSTVNLIFKRSGLWSWKLTSIVLPKT